VGLDVYVGSFTRYYAGQWETIVQQAGRQIGMVVQVVRSQPGPDDALTDPDEIRQSVLAWRAGIGQQLRQAGLVSSELAWREDVASPYYTDKPAWDCYGALQLLAAHEEAPSRLSWRNRYPKRLAEGWNRDRILTRLSNGMTQCRYSHLYGVEVWLPLEFPSIFEAPLPNGHPTRFGSSPQLLTQLHELNRRTYQGTPDGRAAWRAEQPDGSTGPFEPRAKTGLAVMLDLTDHAVRERLPMLLDY
jgi:hypothetical protein